MAKRGKQVTHWGEDEKSLLWSLGRSRKIAGLSWDEIAAKVSKVRRVVRTAAACAAYFERELAHFDEYPPKKLVVHISTTAGKSLASFSTTRSLGEVEEFLAAPAARSKENGHGRHRSTNRNDARA